MVSPGSELKPPRTKQKHTTLGGTSPARQGHKKGTRRTQERHKKGHKKGHKKAQEGTRRKQEGHKKDTTRPLLKRVLIRPGNRDSRSVRSLTRPFLPALSHTMSSLIRPFFRRSRPPTRPSARSLALPLVPRTQMKLPRVHASKC